jgi:transcriptional activator SPT8
VDAVKDRPLPPHLTRRSILVPAFTSPPSSVSIEAIVAIPLPTPVYSIATTTCSSYLLTGGADGRVRAYDFWASVNGKQMMTAQQRTLVGLGDVTKAGVARGWWSNEVDGIADGAVSKRMEAVYSMAVEGDGLWALTGTQVSSIKPPDPSAEASPGRSTCIRSAIRQAIWSIRSRGIRASCRA